MKIDEKKSEMPSKVDRAKLYFRSRLLFVSVISTLTLFLVWPGYKIFADSEPLILGFPLSFAWVIFCTIIGFLALLRLYYSDNQREEAG